MKFLFYDIIFLVIFGLFLIIFLYKKRKNLKREGILYLYKTKWGIKFIDCVGKKYEKSLKVLSYVVVTVGFVLMIAMLYLLGHLVYIFASAPEVIRAIKIPPLMPLIPYLPSIFKIDFLPPFYFTYWIIAIAVIAISHEFSHGIFARLNKVKIKSTGFGFLGPFLAAFVEPDEKQMAKKSKFSQMSILSAGSFANVIMTIIFFLILVLFFFLSFTEAGATFNNYVYTTVNIAGITALGNYSLGSLDEREIGEGILDLIENKDIESDLIIDLNGESLNLTKIETQEGTYFTTIQDLKIQLEAEQEKIIIFDDKPAINAGLKGAIIEINNVKIKNIEDLSQELGKYKPGQEITIKTKFNDEILDYDLKLGESSENKDTAFLGISTIGTRKVGFFSFIYNIFNLFKKPSTAYEPKFDTNLIIFIYNLLWWIIIINISVALINMLPVGIFDGGRVFFLTAFALTKNEKLSKKLFSMMTYIILFIFLLLMIFWFFSFV